MPVVVNDVLTQIAAVIHEPGGPAALQSWWTPIATEALNQANRDVYGTLAARALTPVQIASWRDFDSAVLQQAKFWAWVDGGPMQSSVPTEDPRELDLREWLKTATLVDAAGVVLAPSPGTNAIGRGAMSGSFAAYKALEPTRRLGFVEPGTGRLVRW